MRTIIRISVVLCLALMVGCTTINYTHVNAYAFNCHARWGIATFTNNTDVPQAGIRAMSITAGVLRSKGIVNLATYQPRMSCNQLIICPNMAIPVEQVRSWAIEHHVRYTVMGAVNEWQYKVGLDGEPVAAVALQVYDSATNQIVWSSVGSKIGSSHSGLSNTAQDLIDSMLRNL